MLHPSTGSELATQILEMDEMMYCVERIMDGCPEELRLEPASTSVTADEDHFFRLVQDNSETFPATLPSLSTPPKIPKASYQAQQANLYVTQVSLQSRES